MTAELLCEKYDLPASQCAHCTGAEARHDAEQAREQRNRVPAWPAQFPGRCRLCTEEIKAGEMIVSGAFEGSRSYVHEGCVDRAP